MLDPPFWVWVNFCEPQFSVWNGGSNSSVIDLVWKKLANISGMQSMAARLLESKRKDPKVAWFCEMGQGLINIHWLILSIGSSYHFLFHLLCSAGFFLLPCFADTAMGCSLWEFPSHAIVWFCCSKLLLCQKVGNKGWVNGSQLPVACISRS